MADDYARTMRAWQARLRCHYPEVAGLVGLQAARALRLYLSGSALAVEERRMTVHEILAGAAGRR